MRIALLLLCGVAAQASVVNVGSTQLKLGSTNTVVKRIADLTSTGSDVVITAAKVRITPCSLMIHADLTSTGSDVVITAAKVRFTPCSDDLCSTPLF